MASVFVVQHVNSREDGVKSKGITQENFKRLKVGMAQADVRKILGGPSAGRTDRETRNRIHTWERSRRVTVSFKDGKVNGFSSLDSTGE